MCSSRCSPSGWQKQCKNCAQSALPFGQKLLKREQTVRPIRACKPRPSGWASCWPRCSPPPRPRRSLLEHVQASGEHLLRTPLKELLPQLDPQRFWQIHRSAVVRADAIDTVERDEAGRLHLALRGCPDRLAVSRLYAHLFKAM